MTARRLLPLLAASIAVLAVAGAAFAGPPATAHPAKQPPATRTAPAGPVRLAPAYGGLVVGIDPETKVLGPATTAQRLELFGPEAAFLSRSTEGLVETALPGGGVMLNLGGRFQELSYVRRGPDGRLVFDCTNDLATVRKAFATPVPPVVVQPLEER